MVMFAAAMRRLNREFDEDRIHDFARRIESFAPGRPLNASLLLEPGTPLEKVFQRYLDHLPGSFRETLRGVIHYAISADPPIPVTFAWAPAAEFELTLWQPACGVTVLFKGPVEGPA